MDDDLKKTSMSYEHSDFLKELIGEGYFKEKADAFHFFATYAILKELNITQEELNRGGRESNHYDSDREMYFPMHKAIKGMYPDTKFSHEYPIKLINALAAAGMDHGIKNFWNEKTKELDLKLFNFE